MTTPEIHRLAKLALDQIERMPKGHVPASRRGMVAACPGHSPTICFRRLVGPVVRVELWKERSKGNCHMEAYPLPTDLEDRASKMLDNL